MKSGAECVYPHAQERSPSGNITQWHEAGIDLRTHMIIEITKALIIRSDGLIYTPYELALRATEITEELLRAMP
jgi:hypothetical protein